MPQPLNVKNKMDYVKKSENSYNKNYIYKKDHKVTILKNHLILKIKMYREKYLH